MTKWDKHFGLYFTSNRVIVAKTAGPPSLVIIVVLVLLGLLFGIGGLTGAVIFGVIVAMVTAKRAGKKFKELGKLSAESILRADKKNFGIPYPEITRVEMKKNKIIILTNREKHKFGIRRGKESEDYVNLIPSVLPKKTFVS